MGILTAMRRQRAIYWALAGHSSSGNPEFAAPVDIRCRWEENSEVQGLGEILRFKATVYTDRVVATGDYLMLGEVSSSTPDDPRDAETWEITAFDTLPNFKATDTLKTASAVPSPLKLLALHGRGVESIVYERITGSTTSTAGKLTETVDTIAVAVAVRGNLGVDDMEMGAGRVRSTDIAFDIPKKYLPDGEPTLQDRIQDLQGRRWEIVSYGENRLVRSWWRLVARRGR